MILNREKGISNTERGIMKDHFNIDIRCSLFDIQIFFVRYSRLRRQLFICGLQWPLQAVPRPLGREREGICF